MPQESALGTSDFVKNDLSTNSAPTETEAVPKQQRHKALSNRNWGGFWNAGISKCISKRNTNKFWKQLRWTGHHRDIHEGDEEALQSTAHTFSQDWEYSVRGITLRAAAVATQEAAKEHLGHLAKPQVRVTTPSPECRRRGKPLKMSSSP